MTAARLAVPDAATKPQRRKRSAPAPRKTSRPRKAANTNETPPAAAARPTQVWTAQFIYASADGSARVSLMSITAESAEAARAVAVAHAPAKDFMVSLHPQSDEQFLGQVRLKALTAAARDG